MSYNAKYPNNPVGNVARNVAKTVSPPMTNIGTNNTGLFSKAKTLMSGKSGIIVLAIFFLLLFVAVIVYIVKEVKGNKYEVGKTITNELIKLSEIDSPVEVPGNEFKEHKPREYTYSFWLYVDGFVQTPGYNKIVFYRGESDNVQQANPIVMMDDLTNQLQFVIRTEGSTLASSDSSIDYRKLKPIIDRNYFENKDLKLNSENINKHLVLTVNSVPRQTWMHYALVVKNNIVTLYQNGEYYITRSINDYMKSKPVETNQKGEEIKYDVVIDKSAGSLYIGRNSAIGGRNAVNGYLSKLEYFTFALNISNVQNIYRKGPLQSNWLRKLGITNYKMQSPIVKIQ